MSFDALFPNEPAIQNQLASVNALIDTVIVQIGNIKCGKYGNLSLYFYMFYFLATEASTSTTGKTKNICKNKYKKKHPRKLFTAKRNFCLNLSQVV